MVRRVGDSSAPTVEIDQQRTCPTQGVGRRQEAGVGTVVMSLDLRPFSPIP